MNGMEWHPVIPVVGLDEISALAVQDKIREDEAARRLFKMRGDLIASEEYYPLEYGYEPPIWHVCDALLGFNWPNKSLEKKLQERFGFGWEEWSRRLREKMGYLKPVKMLLILGGNRSGKSEYSAKRGMLMLTRKAGARVYPLHMSNPRSVRDQQPLFWKYMPPEWRVQTATENAYIKYKKKTGFSENSFICPNNSEAAFLNYMQDRDTALQGLEANLILPDELIPSDWVEEIRNRLITRAGRAILTFTPINGYSPTVKIFCDGAVVMRNDPGYLCPADGGDREEGLALGLTPGEYDELWKMEIGKGYRARAPGSRPDDCYGWILEEPTPAKGHPFKGGDQRRFEELPRVLKCVDERKAVVYFWGNDNPYGNLKESIAGLRNKSPAVVRERFYGKAEKTISVMFPTFSREIHVIKRDQIPEKGDRYMLVDPAADRNYFMVWFLVSGKNVYYYREWPGKYEIPGIGLPGPWAIPSGKNDGRNDGARGEAQTSFGFGTLKYKMEIARLEGWREYREWEKEVSGCGRNGVSGKRIIDEDELIDWVGVEAEEQIEDRLMDSRAASAPRIENDRPETLQTMFSKIGLDFGLTPGAEIQDGVSKINSALNYEEASETPYRSNGVSECGSKDADTPIRPDAVTRFINPPKFYICEDCENGIFALENWTNIDKDRGAMKEPIDLIRYFYTADLDYADPEERDRGGMSYGVRIRNGLKRYGSKRRLPIGTN